MSVQLSLFFFVSRQDGERERNGLGHTVVEDRISSMVSMPASPNTRRAGVFSASLSLCPRSRYPGIYVTFRSHVTTDF